jgi:hypothetical protein
MTPATYFSRPGVLHAVEVKRVQVDDDEDAVEPGADAVAVIADQWWRARKAIQDIKIEWDAGKFASGDNSSILADLRAGLDQSADQVLRLEDDAEVAMASASQILEASTRCSGRGSPSRFGNAATANQARS